MEELEERRPAGEAGGLSHICRGFLAAMFWGLVFGCFVMLLWNWVMPGVFAGLEKIGYWQAVGLLLLARLLFGGSGRSGRGHFRARRYGRPEYCHDWAWGDFRYYEAWWKAEGKQALAAYAERRRSEEQPKGEKEDNRRGE